MVKTKKRFLLLKVVGATLLLVILGALVAEGFYLPKYLIKAKKFDIFQIPTNTGELTLMSCNVRCWAVDDLGKKSWFYRADLVGANIAGEAPDIIGFQEVTRLHYKYLNKTLVGYDNVMQYRDDTFMSEGCPVYYRADRFELLDKGSFWLSETPEVMSKDWGAACYRICSYVILKEKASDKEFVVFNTHLDHVSDEARVNGIGVVLEKIKEFGGLPAVLMGDLNANEDSVTYAMAAQNFLDAKLQAAETMDSCTYQNWGAKLGNPRIDYMMISKSGLTAQSYKVVTTTYDGVYPSDHFPLSVRLRLE